MSTPQDRLGSIAGLFDPPPPAPSSTRGAASSSPAPPAASNPHGAYDSQTTGSWSISDAPKVEDWYRQTYGRDLPVTAFGQSSTHDRMGLDHSDAMDVGLNPASDEGKALRDYLRQNNIPFLAYDRAVPGAATAPHIHVGFPSHRGAAGVAARLGSVSSLFDSSQPDKLDSVSHLFDSQGGDALDSIKGLFDSPDDGDVVSIESAVNRDGSPRPHMLPPAAEPQSLPALDHTPAPDLQTEEGRVARDERYALERTPGTRLEVAIPLPSNLEGADSGSLVRDAYKSAALARGVPAEFFDKWASENAPDGYSLHDAHGNQLTVADAMTPDAFDERNHSLRVRIDPNHLSKIVDDYKLSQLRSVPGLEDAKSLDDVPASLRALTVDDTSPGEKALAAAQPVASAAGSVLDKAGKVVNALTAAEWSQLRGADQQSSDLGAAGTSVGVNPKGAAAVFSALEGEEVPEYARNPVGEAARNSQTLADINPRLPAFAGAAGDLVDPLSLVPVEGVGELTEGGRLGRAAEAAGDAARGAGLLDRGLVEARPLGLEAAHEAEPAALSGRLDRVLEVTRKVKAGEPLTPEESTLADEVRAKYAGEARTPVSDEPKAGMASLGELSPELRGMVADPEPLAYARARQQFYTEQAASAKDPVARQAAQQNADAYAADVARMEAQPHHSGLQPRKADGQFAEGLPLKSAQPGDDYERLYRSLGPHADGDADALTLMHADREGNALLQKIASGDVGDGETVRQFRAKAQEYGVSEGTQADLIRQSLEERRAASVVAGLQTGTRSGLPSRVMNTASDIINAPKSIKSSMALHGPFRQGMLQAAAHPTFLKDAIANQVKAFASEDAFQDFARSIIERPDYQEMKDAGLFLPSVYDAEGNAGAGALMREERFASGLAEKVPGVRRSERAYLAAMDSLRTQAWDTYMADLTANGAKPSKETLSAMADWINVSTGRGSVPLLDRTATGRKVVAALNTGFWSPRAMASRFNLISPYRLAKNLANPATRDVAFLQLRDSMRALATLGATATLLSRVPGVRVGFNPYRSDWGKITVGKSSYDLVDGIPSTAKFAARMARSFYMEAEGRKLPERTSPEALAGDFLRRRLSPSGQVVADTVTGRTLEGGKPNLSGEARDLLVPFVVNEMYRGWLSAGGSSVGDALDGNKPIRTGFRGAAKGLPALIGVPSGDAGGRSARPASGDAAPQNQTPVPESPVTLRSQFKSASDPQSPRAAVLVTPGAKLNNAPSGFVRIDHADGQLFVNADKAKALGLDTPGKIRAFVSHNGYESLIGKVAPVADTSRGVALRTEDAEGNELSTSIVPTPEAARQQAAVDRAQFPQAASQEIMPAQAAAARRLDERARK